MKGSRDEAFRTLFELYYDKVYRAAWFVTRDPELAQDVLQETFLKAYRKLDRVDDGNRIGAWLCVIATNTAIDLLRRRKRWNELPTDNVILENEANYAEHASTVEAALDRMQDLEQLRQCMLELKPEYRQVLYLQYGLELKLDEIAEMLGVRVGTIKSRIHRAKNQLRDRMRKEQEREEEMERNSQAHSIRVEQRR